MDNDGCMELVISADCCFGTTFSDCGVLDYDDPVAVYLLVEASKGGVKVSVEVYTTDGRRVSVL